MWDANTGKDILRSLSTQFGFPLRSYDSPTAVDKLDHILARRALHTFTERLMHEVLAGVQVGSLMISVAEDYEDACNFFRPQMMRFAGAETSAVFDKFVKCEFRLDDEVPRLFGPSRIFGKYTSRMPLDVSCVPTGRSKYNSCTCLLATRTRRGQNSSMW